MNSNEKTAIVFTGTGRSLEYTHENLKENLINTIDNCDVFILLAKTSHAKKIHHLLDIPELKCIYIEEDEEPDLVDYKFRAGFPSAKTCTKQQYVKMINQRYNANDLLCNYENRNSFKYDNVIFSRLDVKYFNEVGPNLHDKDMTTMYIPDFHNCFGGCIDGINDRFAASNRDNMGTYFSLPSQVKQFVKEGGRVDPETFLNWHIVKSNNITVNHLPIRFGRVRPDGSEIDKRLESSIHKSDT